MTTKMRTLMKKGMMMRKRIQINNTQKKKLQGKQKVVTNRLGDQNGLKSKELKFIQMT